MPQFTDKIHNILSKIFDSNLTLDKQKTSNKYG